MAARLKSSASTVVDLDSVPYHRAKQLFDKIDDNNTSSDAHDKEFRIFKAKQAMASKVEMKDRKSNERKLVGLLKAFTRSPKKKKSGRYEILGSRNHQLNKSEMSKNSTVKMDTSHSPMNKPLTIKIDLNSSVRTPFNRQMAKGRLISQDFRSWRNNWNGENGTKIRVVSQTCGKEQAMNISEQPETDDGEFRQLITPQCQEIEDKLNSHNSWNRCHTADYMDDMAEDDDSMATAGLFGTDLVIGDTGYSSGQAIVYSYQDSISRHDLCQNPTATTENAIDLNLAEIQEEEDSGMYTSKDDYNSKIVRAGLNTPTHKRSNKNIMITEAYSGLEMTNTLSSRPFRDKFINTRSQYAPSQIYRIKTHHRINSCENFLRSNKTNYSKLNYKDEKSKIKPFVVEIDSNVNKKRESKSYRSDYQQCYLKSLARDILAKRYPTLKNEEPTTLERSSTPGSAMLFQTATYRHLDTTQRKPITPSLHRRYKSTKDSHQATDSQSMNITDGHSPNRRTNSINRSMHDRKSSPADKTNNERHTKLIIANMLRGRTKLAPLNRK